MEKEFVPYKQALSLKEIGFDEPCLAHLIGFGDGTIENGRYVINHQQVFYPNDHTALDDKAEELGLHPFVICGVPLYQQAFRWFRERDFHTTIESYHCLGNDKPFGLGIDQKINGIWDYVDYSGDGNFDTYEEAQIKAIESILEIMEKKSE